MQLTTALSVAILAFCATVSALPTPGGPKGGTPHACHEAKAAMYQRQGNSRMAAKEKHLAKQAIDHHHAQGHHKRWALAYPAVPAVCRQAARVQEKNHPGRAGVEKGKKFLG